MKTIDITQSHNLSSELLQSAHSGLETLLTDGNKPLSTLTPLEKKPKRKRIAGLHAGMGEVNDDFDAPLPESFWTE